MSRYYDEQFKREVAKKYLSGERTMDILEKYGVTKSSIYEWSRKYSEECPDTTGNTESSIFQQTLIITILKTGKVIIENVRELSLMQLSISVMITTGLLATGEWSSF